MKADFVLRVEHSDLAPNPSWHEDIWLLITIKCQSSPRKGVKVFLQVFVLVLHENGPIVDVDYANAIPAAGRNFGSRFRRVFWIGLEYNFPNLQNKIESNPGPN